MPCLCLSMDDGVVDYYENDYAAVVAGYHYPISPRRNAYVLHDAFLLYLDLYEVVSS